MEELIIGLAEQLKSQGISFTLLAYFSYFFYSKSLKLEDEIKELRAKYESFMQDVNDELKDVVHKNTAILEKVSDQLKK